MKLYTNNIVLRICATLLAIGWAVVGLFALSMVGQAPDAELADRAFWMGVTFLIAAAAALSVSWLVADLSNIWCIAPRRTKQRRIDLD